MFDSWDDYIKAVFNPAASTYDMIMEAETGFRDQSAKSKENKRHQAEADAESATRVQEAKAATRKAKQTNPDSSSSSSGTSSSASGDLASGSSSSGSIGSSVTTGEVVAAVGLLAVVVAGIYYFKGR